MALKGLVHRLTHPRAQHRSRRLKSTKTFCEEAHLLIYSDCLRVGHCWVTLWGQRLAGAIFESASISQRGAFDMTAARGQLYIACLWWPQGLRWQAHRTVANRERVLKRLPPSRHSKGQQQT